VGGGGGGGVGVEEECVAAFVRHLPPGGFQGSGVDGVFDDEDFDFVVEQ